MSIEANRALVIRFYELMSELEFDKMFELMADDATWTVAGNPSMFHHAGTVTKPQRAEALASFTKLFTSLQQDIRSMTAEEDRVAVEVITRCKTVTGIDYENELLILIRCRDGKIVDIYEHVDQGTALDFERRLAASMGQQPAH